MFNSRSSERTHMSDAAERPERLPPDPDDGDPARGIVLGVVLGAALWLVMIALAISVWR